MVTQTTIENLLAACDAAADQKSHIPVSLEDFVDIVDASGTDIEGYLIAADRLRGYSLEEPLAVEAGTLKLVLEAAAKALKPASKYSE